MIGCPSPFRTATAGSASSLRPTCRLLYDAQIFTNDREKLGAALGHDVSHTSAHVPEYKPEQSIAPQQEVGPRHEQGSGFGIGF